MGHCFGNCQLLLSQTKQQTKYIEQKQQSIQDNCIMAFRYVQLKIHELEMGPIFKNNGYVEKRNQWECGNQYHC